jgi:hypothetical protein
MKAKIDSGVGKTDHLPFCDGGTGVRLISPIRVFPQHERSTKLRRTKVHLGDLGRYSRSRGHLGVRTAHLFIVAHAGCIKSIADDPRLNVACADGDDFLRALPGERFDFIFADRRSGKYRMLHEALELLSRVACMLSMTCFPSPTGRTVVPKM